MWKDHCCYGYIVNCAFRSIKQYIGKMACYFIGIYEINNTLHGCWEVGNLSSRVKKYFTSERSEWVEYLSTLEDKFRISVRLCNVLYLFRTISFKLIQGFLYGRDRSRGKVFLHQHCALRKFLVIGQNARDQISRKRRSKRARSDCTLCSPFIRSGSPNECWLPTCRACIIATWRLALRPPLVVRI